MHQVCFDILRFINNNYNLCFWDSICLAGGNSLIKRFSERFENEIKNLANKDLKEKIKVISAPERLYSPFIGGSILSSISTFESKWITKTEYEESGTSICGKKRID